jgi:hypothetical protein
MVIYVGLKNKNIHVENGVVTGGSVEILCNPMKNLEGVAMTLRYFIDSSFLDLADCFSVYDQESGLPSPKSYCDVLRRVASRQRTREPSILLVNEGILPHGNVICGAIPPSEEVYIARVFRKDILEKLEQFGRAFG